VSLFKKNQSPKPEVTEDTFEVKLVYSLKSNDFKLSAPGVPTVMLYGIIQMGLSVCMQKQVENQILAKLNAAAEASKIKVAGANEMPAGVRA
jgi:hypothetical protein